MGKNVVEVILKAKDLTNSVLSKFQRNFRAVRRVVADTMRAVTAFTIAVGAATVGLTKLSERGEKVNAVKTAFARITGDETRALNLLRAAAQGTVDDFQLMALANQAMTLGAAKSVEEFAEMVRLSRILGRAQGIEATEALDKFTVALARQSALRADDLGLQLKGIDATRFAAEFMDQARKKAEELSGGIELSTSAAQRFSTAFVNLKDQIASFIAESPELAKAFDFVTMIVDSVSDALGTGDMERLKQVMEAIGGIAGNAFMMAFQQALADGFNALDKAVLPKFLEERIATPLGIFGGAAEANVEQLRGNMDAWVEVLRSLQRGQVLERGGGGVGGGGGGGGAAATLNIPNALGNIMFRQDAFAGAHRTIRGRGGPRLVPITPTSLSGLTSPGAPAGASNVIDAETIKKGSDAMAEAGQVVTASMFGMAQAAVRGSDQVAESVVSMITQIVQSLPGVGGIFGTIIGGVGGLIGAAFSRDRNPVPVRVADVDDAAARKWQNYGQPIRITTIMEVGGVEVQRVERELIDRQNRDEVVRYSNGNPVISR